MAKDDIKETVADVEQIKKAESEANKFFKLLTKIGNTKAFDKLSKGLHSVINFTDKSALGLREMTGEVTELEKALGISLKTRNKAMVSAIINLTQYQKQTAKASQELQEINEKLEESIVNHQKQAEAIKQLTHDIEELEKRQKSRQKLTKEEIAQLDHLKKQLVETKALYEGTKNEILDLADAESKHKQSVINNRKNTLAELEVMRMRNHEFDIMQGGGKAVSAQLKKIADQRFFKFAGELSSGVAGISLLTIAAAKANKAIAETADYMKATRGVAVSLGQEMKGGVWEGFWGATRASVNLMKISTDLGVKLEEVAEAASKVRLGIRMDREGQLTERAIGALTAEAVRFAKIADMDAASAVDLLDKRIKQFGMSAGQAEADMRNMRVTLGQMSAGSRTNAVSIGEMVSILEEASAASQSYVVDTRMMTQALRGAVNQSQLLGASQKEAKDIAKATGKVFGSAPDWVRVPASHTLMNQLLGADSDKFLARFNSATQKRLLTLRNAVRAGEVGNESASRELMDLIANSDAGMEAQFDQIKNVLFVNGKRATNAALVIKEQFSLENMAVAGMLTRMMQDAAELQQDAVNQAMKNGMSESAAREFAKKSVPFSTAMAKQTASFNQSIEDALKNGKSALDALTKQGMTEDAAKEYIDFFNKNAAKEKKYQQDIQAVIDDRLIDQGTKERKLFELKKKHNEEYVRHQMDLAKKGTDPIGALLDRLKVDGEAVSIDVSQFKKAGYENAEAFAKAMGITNDEQVAEIKRLYETDGKIQGEKLREMRNISQEEAKKQEEYLTGLANKLSEGLGPAFTYLMQSILATFGVGGPFAGAITTVLAAVAGVMALFKGPVLIENMIARGVARGVTDAGGINGGGGSGGAGTGETPNTPEDPRETKRSQRQAARRKAKEAASEGLQTFRSGKGVRGRLAGFKSLASSSKYLSQGLGMSKLVPGIGTALSVGLGAKNIMDARADIDERTDLSDRQKSDLKTKSTGREVGGMIGSVALGALGTAIGGPLGGLAGAALGDWLGKHAGEITGDFINKFSQDTPVTPMPQAPTGAITGASTAMTVPKAPLGGALQPPQAPGNVGATQIAMAMSTGGAAGLKDLVARPKIGGVNPDGAVNLNLKIENFIDLFSSVQQMMARTNIATMKT